MGTTIIIAQQKGGAGKTTLAAQLAVLFAGRGLAGAIMDIDPQQSLSAWHAARQRTPGNDGGIALRQVSAWRSGAEVQRLGRDFDLVFIDSPPHGDTDSRVAVRAADRVLMPIQPSPMAYWAARQTIDLAQREGKDFTLVLNRLPSRGRLADRIRAMITADGLKVAHTTLGNRQAFASSMLDGLGVTEAQPKGLAAQEISALGSEMLGD